MFLLDGMVEEFVPERINKGSAAYSPFLCLNLSLEIRKHKSNL